MSSNFESDSGLLREFRRRQYSRVLITTTRLNGIEGPDDNNRLRVTITTSFSSTSMLV